MMITIISENNAMANIIGGAVHSYFEKIEINQASNPDNIIFNVTDDSLQIKIDDNAIVQFTPPYRVGQLLEAIKNAKQNTLLQKQSAPIQMGDIILDPQEKTLEKERKKFRLTDKEFDILFALYQSSPNKIQRDKLLHLIWGYGESIETHTLETHIYRLRQKIETDPANPNFLKTDDDGYFLKF